MKPEDVVIRENHEPLVALDPTEFDLKPQYVKRGFASDARVFVRETVRDKLRAVKAMLPLAWNVRIWDGWRSMALQATLYDDCLRQLRTAHPALDDERIVELARGYLYPPIKSPPPPHSTGGTVDLTLADATGQAVNFGTNFDEFSDRSHADYFDHHGATTKADTEAKANRAQLRFLMESQDFVVNPKEWWHWSYGTAQWAAAKGVEIARYGITVPSE